MTANYAYAARIYVGERQPDSNRYLGREPDARRRIRVTDAARMLDERFTEPGG